MECNNSKKVYKRRRKYAVDDISKPQNEAISSTAAGMDSPTFPWTSECIKMMLQFRFERNKLFDKRREKNREIWNEISCEMMTKGYIVSGDACQVKYRNLLQTYKKNVIKEERGMKTWIIWEFYDIFKQGLQNSTVATEQEEDVEDVETAPTHDNEETIEKQMLPTTSSNSSTIKEKSTLSVAPINQRDEEDLLNLTNSDIEDQNLCFVALNSTRSSEVAIQQELSADVLQECRAFGESITLQLANIKSERTRALLQFKFQELLYKAKIGQLTE